ncbi:MAG TPA: hypothetical protein VH989_02350 [Actinomycetota bacterium]
MRDRLRGLTDDDLGRALSRWVAWPEPSVSVEAVTRGIEEAAREPRSLRPRLSLPSRRRTISILVAATLALATAAVAAKLVLDLGAITITTVPSVSPLPTRSLGPGDLGTPVSLQQAAGLAGFTPRVPTALGAPDRVWVDRVVADFAGKEVTTIVLAWEPRENLPAIEGSDFGAVLMEFRGQANVASKILGEGSTTIVPTSVGDLDATFITGPHELDLLDGGRVRRFVVRGTVVLWNEGELAFRLETDLGEVGATDIAAS